jgi:hypothetical protein
VYGVKLPLETAARQLGVPVSTFRAWVVASNVPTVRVGNYRFIGLEEAKAVIAKHEYKQTQTGLTF